MSEKYVLEKYIALINKGFCSDCNELNCIDNYPSKKIASCIDVILKENTNLKQTLNKIREYVLKEKKFNDNQIEEYKTSIKTNANSKFNDKEKENMEQSMTVNICINYKMNDILKIIDKVLGGSDE